MILCVSTILTDQAFLDVCVKLARLETRIDGLYYVLVVVVVPIVISVFQNYYIHKQLKNGCKKENQ